MQYMVKSALEVIPCIQVHNLLIGWIPQTIPEKNKPPGALFDAF